MIAPGPIHPEVLRRMQEVLVTAMATRSATLAEAAAEARGLGQGLQPALPASVVNEAVTSLLVDLGTYEPPPAPVAAEGHRLLPVDPAEVTDTLACAMRFDERGKARRFGVEDAARLAAETLIRQL
jgi:hypothetical protein